MLRSYWFSVVKSGYISNMGSGVSSSRWCILVDIWWWYCDGYFCKNMFSTNRYFVSFFQRKKYQSEKILLTRTHVRPLRSQVIRLHPICVSILTLRIPPYVPTLIVTLHRYHSILILIFVLDLKTMYYFTRFYRAQIGTNQPGWLWKGKGAWLPVTLLC